jgi:hypothetical protein
MSKPIHPLLAELLRMGARAGLAALDSTLGDVEKIGEEAVRRVKRARGRARKITEEEEEEE